MGTGYKILPKEFELRLGPGEEFVRGGFPDIPFGVDKIIPFLYA
jgi:hypothetical protein